MADTKLINANIDENAGIAWLILNRPEKKNALSIILLAELSSILRALAENDKIRCIVTTGGGDSYSSGRDLYDMRGQDNRRRTRGFGGVAEIVDIMRKLPQVTVAKVRGWCLGGGLALINGHDLGHQRREREIRYAGSHPRQLRRYRDTVALSRRHSIQESFLYFPYR